MSNDTTFSEALRDEIHLRLDELARRGAQRMSAAVFQAEVDEYIHRHSSERDENNHALVVRNGHGWQRNVQCGAGELKIQAPRVHDKRPGQKFSSAILPPYMRKSPRLEEAVPILCAMAILKQKNSSVGYTKSPTCLISCRNGCSRWLNPTCTKSCAPKDAKQR